MSKIKKTSWTVVSPSSYVKAVLSGLGGAFRTPVFSHDLVYHLLHSLPQSILNRDHFECHDGCSSGCHQKVKKSLTVKMIYLLLPFINKLISSSWPLNCGIGRAIPGRWPWMHRLCIVLLEDVILIGILQSILVHVTDESTGLPDNQHRSSNVPTTQSIEKEGIPRPFATSHNSKAAEPKVRISRI